MSCAMIYWGPNVDAFMEVFSDFGAVVDLRTARVPQHTRRGTRGQLTLMERANKYAPKDLRTPQMAEMGSAR